MKSTLILTAMMAIATSSFAFEPIVNEKVLNNFNKTFTAAEHVKWDEFKDHYSVSFFHLDIRTIVNYDKSGNMISSIRYYTPSMLPLNIVSRLTEDYPDGKLFGVTEISRNNEIYYFVKVELKKHWLTLRVSPNCEVDVHERFKKA